MVRHQLCHTAAHRASKPFDSIQRHISLTTLNIADASPVQTGTLGKLLLRHSMVFANRSQTMAEALIESHPANDAGILFRVYSVGCTSSGCDILKNSDSFGLTKKRSGCLIIRHKIAETGSFRQDMQKSGSGHCGWHHVDSDQGPEMNQQARPLHCPTAGNIARTCHNLQDATVEFTNNSKYRVAGCTGRRIRYVGRTNSLAAFCRDPGDWRCIF